jgi:hypothetical protein
VDPDPDPDPRIHASHPNESGLGSGPDPDLDPDLALFVIDLQDVNKKLFILSFPAYYFLKVHIHYFRR